MIINKLYIEWSNMMQVVNIVAMVEMENPFNMEELLTKLPGVEKTNHWVKAKIPPYNKYTAFYSSGKFLITGIKSEQELNNVVENVVLYIKKYGIDNNIKKININNRVLTDTLGFEVNLEKLIVKLKDYNASYEPEVYHCLHFKDKNSITYSLFSSGKIIIVGVKSLNNLEQYVNEFKALIKEKTLN